MIKKILLITLLFFNLKADYVNVTIEELVNKVATLNNLNIVMASDIDNKATIFINSEITAQTNLNIVRELLELNGYKLEQKANFYIISSLKNKKINKFKIYKVSSSTDKLLQAINPTLNALFVKKDTFRPIKNSLINSSNSPNNSRYKNKSTQNNPYQQTRSYDNTRKKNRASTLSTANKDYTLTQYNNDTLILTYKYGITEKLISSIIKQIDRPPKQLTLKMEILEADTGLLTEIGINLGARGQYKSENKDLGVIIGNSVTTLSKPQQTKLTGLLQATENKTKFKIMSNPTLIVLEGEHTSKYIDSTTYPIERGETTISNNGVTSTQKNIIDVKVGTKLSADLKKVQNNTYYLDLKLDIETPVSYKDNNLIFNSRSMSLPLAIKKGQTIILAGLSKTINNKTESGIPLLRDIPLLGVLFGTNSTEKKDITILIKLKVL